MYYSYSRAHPGHPAEVASRRDLEKVVHIGSVPQVVVLGWLVVVMVRLSRVASLKQHSPVMFNQDKSRPIEELGGHSQ
jgi:hypothetical protein